MLLVVKYSSWYTSDWTAPKHKHQSRSYALKQSFRLKSITFTRRLRQIAVCNRCLPFFLLLLLLPVLQKSCHVSGWFRRRWRSKLQMTLTIKLVRAWPRLRRRLAVGEPLSSSTGGATRVGTETQSLHGYTRDACSEGIRLAWRQICTVLITSKEIEKEHSQPYCIGCYSNMCGNQWHSNSQCQSCFLLQAFFFSFCLFLL